MTLGDQIRDEKLQYDINREVAKISALSSGKIDKYEYLTGEEILPYNQQRIIEQAKFTYSPLGKAFEKQTKTIEDKGEKQIKAIQNKDFNKSIEKAKFDSDDDLAILSQKEIYNKLTEETKTQIKNLDESVDRDRDKLIYKYKGNTSDVGFSAYYGAIELINKIFIEYTERISEAKFRLKQEGTGLKILTPKQILQRLPIALSQMKASNNSKSLLNEIRQVV